MFRFTDSVRSLTKKERILWIISAAVVGASNFCTGEFRLLTLIAVLTGVTALIFVAKGDVWGQILTVAFSILYSITSFEFRYYGEIITYLGMSAPIAALSVITWLRHPYEKGRNEVKIHRLTKGQILLMWILTAAVTGGFGLLLWALNTPNLFFSIISITTSFLASFLMLFRNSCYALAYAANDIVLIILWILASMENIAYLPMILCFVMFLVNDLYGYISWRIRERKQKK